MSRPAWEQEVRAVGADLDRAWQQFADSLFPEADGWYTPADD